MESIKYKLRQMALTPRIQIKKLLTGTLGSLFCMLILLLTSTQANIWLFYGFSLLLGLFVIYAIPGYLGIWLWRMRKFFFDLD